MFLSLLFYNKSLMNQNVNVVHDAEGMINAHFSHSLFCNREHKIFVVPHLILLFLFLWKAI